MTTSSSPPPASGPGVPAQPLPGWLGSAVQITTQVGVPTVFAAVLLWFVLTKVTGTLQSIEKYEDERTRILTAMQDTLVAALNRQNETFERTIRANIDANRSLYEAARQERERILDRLGESAPRRPREESAPR